MRDARILALIGKHGISLLQPAAANPGRRITKAEIDLSQPGTCSEKPIQLPTRHTRTRAAIDD